MSILDNVTKIPQSLSIRGAMVQKQYTAGQIQALAIPEGETVVVADTDDNLWKCSSKKKEKLTTVNDIYPVGSIYFTLSELSPEDIFGGKWERIQGRFLLGASDTYPAGASNGSATAKLEPKHMPAHTHKLGHGGQVLAVNTTEYSEVSLGFAPEQEGGLWGRLPKALSDIASAGEGQAFSIMPPYLAVFIWKRTA